jgi:hypothetical protein
MTTMALAVDHGAAACRRRDCYLIRRAIHASHNAIFDGWRGN